MTTMSAIPIHDGGVYATIISVEQLHLVLRERANELRRSRLTIDQVAGVADGLASKLLADPPIKRVGLVAALSILQALGLRLVLIEDAAALRRLLQEPPRDEAQVRTTDHWRIARRLTQERESYERL